MNSNYDFASDVGSNRQASAILRPLLSIWAILALLVVAAPQNMHAGLPNVTVMDTGVCIPLPANAVWNNAINFRPTSNQVVNFNPPQFSWCYVPEGAASVYTDQNMYLFTLQVDTSPSFPNPQINLTNLTCNFYNFLPPLQNNNGNTFYWRVGYATAALNTSNVWVTNAPSVWITNSFQLSPTATNWDRSSFANLASGRAVHPYMLINNTNAPLIYNWLQTNQIPWVKAEWSANQSDARNCFSQSWYNANPGWINNSTYAAGSFYLTKVACMWRLTTNSFWTNQTPTPMSLVTNLAGWFLSEYFDQGDDVGNFDPIPATVPQLAYLYDWFYDAMDSGQRQLMQTFINDYSSYESYYNILVSTSYAAQGYKTNRTYPPPYQCWWSSEFKIDNSHGHQDSELRYPIYLAGINESSAASNAWLNWCNYYLAPGFYAGHDGCPQEPRDYNQTGMYAPGSVGCLTWANAMLTGAMFPEGRVDYNPFFHKAAQFIQMLNPVQFYELNDPWADGAEALGMRNLNALGEGNCDAMDFVAMLTGDGMAQSHWQRQFANTGSIPSQSGGPLFYSPMNFLLPYFYPPPAPVTNSTLAYCFPEDGWVEAVSSPANQEACFSNGVGIIFRARPEGFHGSGHMTCSDGEIQIWSHGANVTDSGEFYNNYQARYVQCSWSHYCPTIDGIGQFEDATAPTTSWYSRIIAFTNAPDYVFWAADLTKTYPVDQRNPSIYYQGGGSGIWPLHYLQLACSNLISDVSSVQRYILFNHHQYVVIYDSFASANPHTWALPYHIMEPTLFNDYGATFTYTSSNQITGAGTRCVTNFVFQCVNSNLLTVTNMTGTNVKGNPFTGENYSWITPGDPYVRATAKWISNAQPTNNFHLMTVIYPVPPGGTAPAFGRLDDSTVAITNGTQVDIISFEPNSTNAATFVINTPAIAATAGVDTNVYVTVTPFIQSSNPGGTTGSGSPPPQAITEPTGLHLVAYTNGSQLVGYVYNVVNNELSYSTTNLTIGAPAAPPPGYYAWWNPDKGVSQNSVTRGVTNWQDQGPNGFNANTLVLGGNYPTYAPVLGTQNGHNVIWFSPGNNRTNLLSAMSFGPITNGPIEIFMVIYDTGNQAAQGWQLTGGGSPSLAMLDNISGISEGMWVDSVGKYINSIATAVPSTNQWAVVTALFNGPSSQMWINGASVGTNTIAGGSFSNLLFMSISGDVMANGEMGDVLFYTNVLSSLQQQTLELGLRGKYGF